MKKLLLITSLIAFVAFAQAQTILTFSPGGRNTFSYTGVAGDTISGVSGSVHKIIDVSRATGPVYWTINFTVDSVSNYAGHDVFMYGSADLVNFTQLASFDLAGSAATELEIFSRTHAASDTLIAYPYLRLTLTGDGAGKSKINKIAGKINQK